MGYYIIHKREVENSVTFYEFLKGIFLEVRAPLGLLDVKVKVKVEAKKFRNSMMLLSLLD